jgi:hypothetical protein
MDTLPLFIGFVFGFVIFGQCAHMMIIMFLYEMHNYFIPCLK